MTPEERIAELEVQVAALLQAVRELQRVARPLARAAPLPVDYGQYPPE